jgi:hypothetical protein
VARDLLPVMQAAKPRPALTFTYDAPVAFAIQKGWLTGEGKPTRSICLTNEGRAVQTTSKRIRLPGA